MAPTATAPVRRAPTTRPGAGDSRRAPLRLFEPPPRRRSSRRSARRPTVWASGVLIVGSLLAVVVGDALVTEGQVRLSAAQAKVASAVAAQKSLQVSVAQKTAPPVVVGQAESQGMVAPTQVVYLPQVPLDVPLPAPHTTPLPAPTTTSGAARPASTAPGSTAPGSTTPSTTAPRTTAAASSGPRTASSGR